jgi:hypothetical protein
MLQSDFSGMLGIWICTSTSTTTLTGTGTTTLTGTIPGAGPEWQTG